MSKRRHLRQMPWTRSALLSPGKLREILNEAGVAAARERLLRFTINAPIAVEEFWKLRLEMSEKLREKVRNAFRKNQMTEVTRQALESLGEFSTERGMSFPAEVLMVTGAKGHSTVVSGEA